jgi:hypothetical protein
MRIEESWEAEMCGDGIWMAFAIPRKMGHGSHGVHVIVIWSRTRS